MPISLNEIQSQKKEKGPNSNTGFSISKLLQFELFGAGIKDKERLSFYEQFAVLLEAGLNVKASLELCLSQYSDGKMKDALEGLLKYLTQGLSLSEAMRKMKDFSDFEIYSLNIGEETGNLVQVLLALKDHYSQSISRRRALIGALSYPIVILFTAFGAMAFMFTYLVPMFRDLFGRMGHELPAITEFVIRISTYTDEFFISLFLLITSALLANHLLSTRKSYKIKRAKISMRIPLIGVLLKDNLTLVFLQSMSLLLGAKVPLVRSLELTGKMLNSAYLEAILNQVQKEIIAGGSFSAAMSKHEFFDAKTIALIKVGEESNQLSSLMESLATEKMKEMEHRGKVLSSVLEPLMIIFLGALVAVILIAMYLPMFQMGNAF